MNCRILLSLSNAILSLICVCHVVIFVILIMMLVNVYYRYIMNENPNLIIPFLSEHLIYWVAFLIPTMSTLICFLIYYFIHHDPEDCIPTISTVANQFPQNRLFPICMSIEACILGVIFFIRCKIILKTQKIKNRKKDTTPFLSKWIRILCKLSTPLAYSIAFSLSLASAIQIDDSATFHLIFSMLFLFSILSYFIVNDIASQLAGFSINYFSLLLPYFIVSYLLTSMFKFHRTTNTDSGVDRKLKNQESIFQYVLQFFIFLKVVLMGYDNPPNTLVSTNSSVRLKIE